MAPRLTESRQVGRHSCALSPGDLRPADPREHRMRRYRQFDAETMKRCFRTNKHDLKIRCRFTIGSHKAGAVFAHCNIVLIWRFAACAACAVLDCELLGHEMRPDVIRGIRRMRCRYRFWWKVPAKQMPIQKPCSGNVTWKSCPLYQESAESSSPRCLRKPQTSCSYEIISPFVLSAAPPL